MKSSLKTFLAGKNPLVRGISGSLHCHLLHQLDIGIKNARPYLDNDHNDVVIDGNGDTWYMIFWTTEQLSITAKTNPIKGNK